MRNGSKKAGRPRKPAPGDRPPGLPDYLGEGMKILFIGYNPGLRSAELGHHYAGRGNSFFPLLASAGLIDRPLTYNDDHLLLPEYGYGLTNLVPHPTKGIKDLTAADYRLGRERLRALLERYRPKVAAYVGVGVYKHFSGRGQVIPGVQERSVVAGVIDFVLPSTSGLNARPYREKEQWFRRLRDAVAPGPSHMNPRENRR